MISNFADKFKRAGGMDTLGQYAKAHVLGHAALQILLQGTSQKSLEIVRLSVNNKILGKLRKKYSRFIQEYLNEEQGKKRKTAEQPKDVWILWLSGMENAPQIVQQCCASVQECFTDRPVHVLTEKNYRDFVSFPAYIQEKIDNGTISATHFSDLLRLELLIRYGGTWLDATVFCSTREIPAYMTDSDLFLFQDLKPGRDGHCQRISSWMITACPAHPILRLTRALLYEYWKKNSGMMDYFLFHDFFELAIEAYPKEWDKVVPCSNAAPHILLLRLFEPYDDTIWKAVREMTPFHKLSYKFDEAKTQIPGTYYQKVFGSEKEQ